MKHLHSVPRWLKAVAVLGTGIALAVAPVGSQALPKPQGQIIAVFGNATFPFPTARVVITPGSTVTFRNFDVVAHNVTSTAGLFSSATIGLSGATSVNRVNLLPPGTYPFVCSLHPNMKGALIVKKL